MYRIRVSLSKVITQQHLDHSSCASKATFPECLDKDQSNEMIRGEGSRKDVKEDLTFLPFFSWFLIPLYLSFLLPTHTPSPQPPTSFFKPLDKFLHSFFPLLLHTYVFLNKRTTTKIRSSH